MDLLEQYGLRTLKSLGQNFLHDAAVLQQIADAAPARDILEIGAGVGTLTRLLCEQAERMVTVELDQRLQPLLTAEISARCSNHQFIWQDILTCDYGTLAETHFDGRAFTVVGNLPYYITTDILQRLICGLPHWDSAVLMLQREAAERLVARPGTKEYRTLTVLVQAFSTPELLFTVPPHCFTPAPHVVSAVVKLTPKKAPGVDSVDFLRFVACVFEARRKLFVSAPPVQRYLKKDRAALEALLRQADLPVNCRGETFTPEQFIHVYKLAQNPSCNPHKL